MDFTNKSLMQAASSGDEGRLNFLLNLSDCNPMFRDENGNTALMLAARRGHTACVEILMPVSDILAQDDSGWSALVHAINSGSLSFLRRTSVIREELIRASSGGLLPCVELLLPLSDALTQDKAGATALMHGAASGHAAYLPLMLPKSNPSAKDNQGRTALMYAVTTENSDGVRHLLIGEDALIKDKDGMTALMWAAKYGHTRCVSLLLPLSDVCAADKWGLTARDYAKPPSNEAAASCIDAYVLALSERSALNEQSARSVSVSPGVTHKSAPRRV